MADETFDAATIAKLIGVAVGSGASAALASGASSWWALRAYREGRFSRGWWRLRVGALGGVTTLKQALLEPRIDEPSQTSQEHETWRQTPRPPNGLV